MPSEDPKEAAPVFIELQDVTHAIGEQQILCGVTLEVRRGETMVLIGGSGGGKSVTLKHIIGLMRPDSGHVLVEGQCIASLPERQLADIRRKMGVLFQNGALFDSMSVGQNVAFPLRERGERKLPELTKKVTEALELVGLAEHIDKMPIDLSGGMRKRVALARAMVTHPQCVLYDEPTAGLDPVATDAIDRLILRMQERYSVTSVVVTHDMKSAYSIADRIAFLRDGRVYFCGTPEEIQACEDPVVADFIRGRSSGAL
jgi:phospholipid/cholesterol/gamma-HCH transport system ATP-binding protein